MHPLALAPLSLLPASPLEVIDAAHAAGFDGCGLRLQRVVPSDVDVMADRSMMREIERRVRDTGIRIFDTEVFRVGPGVDVRAMVPALEFAASLGVRHVLCTSMLTGEVSAREEPETVASLAGLCDVAAAFGMTPMLEFMIYRRVGTLSDALRVVRAAARPNLGVCVDVLHLYRSGGDAADVRAIDADIPYYVQLCDGAAAAPAVDQIPIEARYHREYPGEGGLPLLDFLDAARPDVPLSLEVPASRYAHLPPADRARAIIGRTRALLQRHRARPRRTGPEHG